MNLDSLCVPGRSPWAPNDNIEQLDVWRYDGIPTLGTFRSEGEPFLFYATDESYSVWVYLPIAGIETEADGCYTHQSLERLVAWAGRDVVVAAAGDGCWIRQHAVVPASDLYYRMDQLFGGGEA